MNPFHSRSTTELKILGMGKDLGPLIYSQPVDSASLCRATGWTRSGAGPFLLPVLLRAWNSLPDRLRDHHPTLRSDSFWGNHLRRNFMRVSKHTKRSRDAPWFCAIYIHDWHWLWHWPLTSDCVSSSGAIMREKLGLTAALHQIQTRIQFGNLNDHIFSRYQGQRRQQLDSTNNSNRRCISSWWRTI